MLIQRLRQLKTHHLVSDWGFDSTFTSKSAYSLWEQLQHRWSRHWDLLIVSAHVYLGFHIFGKIYRWHDIYKLYCVFFSSSSFFTLSIKWLQCPVCSCFQGIIIAKYRIICEINWVVPAPSNRGKRRFFGDPLQKMVHNPGGDWHPGQGVNPSNQGNFGAVHQTFNGMPFAWRLEFTWQGMLSHPTSLNDAENPFQHKNSHKSSSLVSRKPTKSDLCIAA